ncbi:MAG: arginine repressor [Acidimicrobiia bacterium]
MSPRTATRRRLIRQFVRTATVTSQQQLVEMLEDEGHRVTQATVSRDLDAMGAVKVRGEDEPHYEIGDDERFAYRERSTAAAKAVAEFVESIDHSGNLVVVQTLPGAAHLVAGAIDANGVEGVLGTIAGDDTVLVIATEAIGGRGVAKTLERIGAG